MRFVATGANYSLAVDGAHAIVRVWPRRDLDSASGNRLAIEIADAVVRVLATSTTLALDLREAPVVDGEESIAALASLVRACESVHARVAIVLGGDAVQRLQVRRVATTYAFKATRIFEDEATASKWLAVPDAFACLP